jgi:translation initiation factor 2 beta subunit (eIF-2beta)/eIF-5
MSAFLTSNFNVLPVKTPKIGQRTVEVIQFYVKCPECGKEISATTEKRVEYLLESHKLQVHGVRKAAGS